MAGAAPQLHAPTKLCRKSNVRSPTCRHAAPQETGSAGKTVVPGLPSELYPPIYRISVCRPWSSSTHTSAVVAGIGASAEPCNAGAGRTRLRV